MWVTQMFALKGPWVAGHRKGKEKMKPNDWRGTPNGSGVPFPSMEVNTEKGVFGQVPWQTDDSHFTPG